MKKISTHDEKSSISCLCGRLVKQNLVDKKPNAIRLDCFSCYRNKQESRGHKMVTAREVKSGKKIGRKGGRYNPEIQNLRG